MSSRAAIPNSFGCPAKGVSVKCSAEIDAWAETRRLGDRLKCRSTVIRCADGALSRSERPSLLPCVRFSRELIR